MTKIRGILPKRAFFTQEEEEVLRARYPHENTADIARYIGRTVTSVYRKANDMGLFKTPEFMASKLAGRLDGVVGDQRSETITVTDRSHGNASGTRTLRIEPDTLIDFRALPYPDGSFRLVAFDPPHLVRAGQKSWLAAKYGKLGTDWRDDLRQGFAECFRVLDKDGVLVFKWNETQVKVTEVLALTPVQPLFGHISGRKGLTHWLVFMPPNAEVNSRPQRTEQGG